METKTAVKLANIAGKINAVGALAKDPEDCEILLQAAEDIFNAIRADRPYSLKEEEL